MRVLHWFWLPTVRRRQRRLLDELAAHRAAVAEQVRARQRLLEMARARQGRHWADGPTQLNPQVHPLLTRGQAALYRQPRSAR
jgi:hypothetical protein